MKLIEIPAGNIQLGLAKEKFLELEKAVPSFPYHRELPQVSKKLNAFMIAKYPVTNLEYAQFLGKAGYQSQMFWEKDLELFPQGLEPTHFVDQTGKPGPLTWIDGAPPPGKENHPVAGVSWFEARAFARFKGLRLPQEAEWEYAGRGSSGEHFPWGDSFQEESAVVLSEETGAVDAHPQGASKFGVHHLVGNVAEWCEDIYQSYRAEFRQPQSHERVVRGDGYGGTPLSCRLTVRTGWSPQTRHAYLGFRLAKNTRFRPPPRTIFG